MQQDQMLGASFPLTMEATPMPRTRQLMHNEGMMALNWFACRFSYPGSASIARMHGSLRAQVERRSVVRSVRGKGALFCFGGRVCVLMPAVAVAVRHMGACVCASACGGGDGPLVRRGSKFSAPHCGHFRVYSLPADCDSHRSGAYHPQLRGLDTVPAGIAGTPTRRSARRRGRSSSLAGPLFC
jgi:hypothetical protein